MMVIFYTQSPIIKLEYEIKSRSPLAKRFEIIYSKIEKVEIKIFNAIYASHGGTKYRLSFLKKHLRSTVNKIHDLCLKTSNLENYRFVSETNFDFNVEWVEISQKIERTQEESTRQELEQVRNSLEKRMKFYQESQEYLNKVEASISDYFNELENVFAEVLRLQTLHAEQQKYSIKNIISKLDEINEDLQLLGRLELLSSSLN